MIEFFRVPKTQKICLLASPCLLAWCADVLLRRHIGTGQTLFCPQLGNAAFSFFLSLSLSPHRNSEWKIGTRFKMVH